MTTAIVVVTSDSDIKKLNMMLTDNQKMWLNSYYNKWDYFLDWSFFVPNSDLSPKWKLDTVATADNLAAAWKEGNREHDIVFATPANSDELITIPELIIYVMKRDVFYQLDTGLIQGKNYVPRVHAIPRI